MIDTDERWLHGIDPDIYPFSGLDGYDILRVRAANGGHWSPRVFRLPAKGSYVGRVHEYFHADPGAEEELWEGPEIHELPKTREQLIAKWVRDREVLLSEARKDPLNIRWRFYLGETMRGLAWAASDDEQLAKTYLQDAAMWYLSALKLAVTDKAPSDWTREQGGFAAYRAACCYSESGNKPEAIHCVVQGIEACPWMVELPWYVSWLLFRAKDWKMAVAWSRLAQAVETTGGPTRYGFQEHCKPREVEGFALRAMGDPRGDEILEELGILALPSDDTWSGVGADQIRDATNPGSTVADFDPDSLHDVAENGR
jgi:hypothetical protein